MNKCTCGAAAIHQRQIDGKMYDLCGECNALLECIRANFLGMSVLKAAQMKDGSLEAMAKLKPIIYEAKDVPVIPVLIPTGAGDNVAIQYDPFYPPLRDNHNEVHREPPECEDQESRTEAAVQ